MPKTIGRHQREVRKYEKWLNSKGKEPENATKKDLIEYLQHCKEKRKLCNATQNHILCFIKKYHQYLWQELGVENPTNFIRIRGVYRKRLRPLFTPDEVEQLCELYYHHSRQYRPNNRELCHYPDHKKLMQGRYIALTLFAYQGLRQQEIMALRKTDLDFRKATITIHAGRTGAGRKLPLDASQIGVMMQHFSDENTTIIPNLSQIQQLSETLKELTKSPAASFTTFEDLRQIRASKITQWIKIYGLRKAQILAGHKNIQSTEKYLANDFESLKKRHGELPSDRLIHLFFFFLFAHF